MKNRIVLYTILIFVLTIPLFGQQAVFAALQAADESNRKTNPVTKNIKKNPSITDEISCEGITIEGLIGDVGWIKNTGTIIDKRVRVVNQYLNVHNAGAELTLSMSLLKPGEKVRIKMISENMVFYIYNFNGGLIGFIKADKLSKKETGWFN